MTTQPPGSATDGAPPPQPPDQRTATAATERDATDQALADTIRARRRSQQPPQPKKLDMGPEKYPALAAMLAAPPPTPEEVAERDAEAARRALVRERAERDGQMASLARKVGVRYAECSFGSYRVTHRRQSEALAAARDYAQAVCSGETANLVLWGPVGTGKDHLAFAVCRELIYERGKRIEWVNGQSWFGDNRDALGATRPESDRVRSLVSPDVLVVSDPLPPSGDGLTSYQRAMLYRVVDARYTRARPIVVTLNIADDAEADARMGAAIWDRLCHGAWKVRCAWPTHRTPQREVGH